MQTAVVGIHWYSKTNRKIDQDNLISSLKSGFDGLTDAGLWVDDRDIFYLPPERSKSADNPRVELVIHELNEEQLRAAINSLTGVAKQ